VDVKGRTVDVAEILTEVEGHLHPGQPKTRAGRRIVPLPRVAATALKEHMKAHPGADGDYVFTSPEGGPVRLAGWRNRFWRPAVEKAKLEPLTPHDLRHTAVALWIHAGANPKEVATRAGHTSAAFTLDRYGHLFPGHEDRVNDALDKLAAGAKRKSVAQR
jgi:integrase